MRRSKIILLTFSVFVLALSLAGCQGNLSNMPQVFQPRTAPPSATASVEAPAPTPVSPPPPSSAVSNSELIKKAQQKVVEGLQSYERGYMTDTKEKFDQALSILDRTDLPQDHKDLEMLSIGLPERYKKYNLADVYQEAKSKARATEQTTGEWGTIQVMGEEIHVEELMEDIERKKKAEIEEKEELEVQAASSDIPVLTEDEYIKKEIVRLMAEFGEDDYVVPDVFFTSIKHFIRGYQTTERDFYEKALKRSAKYLPMIKSIFAQKKVPEDMAYMALVESGFNPRAYSRAKAKGLWQFIRSTGRIYGLRIYRRYDERLDPIKSTLAARRYFLDLVAIFGSRSFMLAMASYNAGEMKIQGCLKKLDDPFKERNFWSIRNCLRKETQDYVPRIIAAAIIGRNPKRFGFEDPNTVPFETVILNRQVSLSKIAELTNSSVDTIRSLNTDISGKRASTPNVPNFLLAVPQGTKHTVESQLSKAYVKYAMDDIVDSYNDNIKRKQQTIHYRVRRGDTLTKIGARYGVNWRSIARWNNLKNYRIQPGQRLVIYKGSSGPVAASYSPPAEKGEKIRYRVKKGDTLSEIGKRYGVSYRSIAKWNNLRRNRIKVGQVLTIYTAGKPEPVQQAKVEENGNGSGELRYTVRRGDTLWEIGNKFDVDYKQIADWNDLPNKKIQPGQILTIYKGGKASPPEKPKKGKHPLFYEVEKGNSLYDIGQFFDVGYRDIMRWNNLRSARIYPGKKLKIYTDKEVKLIRYSVKEGDTLIGISKKHNITLSQLLAYNGLTPKDTIVPRSKLKIYVIQ